MESYTHTSTTGEMKKGVRSASSTSNFRSMVGLKRVHGLHDTRDDVHNNDAATATTKDSRSCLHYLESPNDHMMKRVRTEDHLSRPQQPSELWGDVDGMGELHATAGYAAKSADDFEPIPYHSLVRGAPIRPVDNRFAATETPCSTVAPATVRNHPAKQPPATKKKTPSPSSAFDSTVGMDSCQMGVVNKMMAYLDKLCDQGIPYFNGEESTVLASSFRAIITLSKVYHQQDFIKYKNLPGAIFEEAVDVMKSSTFLMLFRIATDGEGSLTTSTTPRANTVSLIEIAVGYGIHLAKQQQLGSNEKIMDVDIQTIVQTGTKDLLRMTHEERMAFWGTQILQKQV